MARGQKGTLDPGLTPKQFEDMARLLRMGMTVTDVCLVAGIAKSTFYKWVAVGKQRPQANPDKPDMLRSFADAVTSGKASAKAYALGMVHVGMKKDWKAAAWLLGVTHPKEYGPKVRVTLEAEFSDAIQRLKKALPPEMYEKAIDALLEGSGEAGEGAVDVGEVGPRIP